MKDYKRLTKRYGDIISYAEPIQSDFIGVIYEEQKKREMMKRLAELEDKIESGKLCDREEVRKETAKEILLLLGKGFDETARKDFKDLQWYKQFCRELELRYGIELFGKPNKSEIPTSWRTKNDRAGIERED